MCLWGGGWMVRRGFSLDRGKRKTHRNACMHLFGLAGSCSTVAKSVRHVHGSFTHMLNSKTIPNDIFVCAPLTLTRVPLLWFRFAVH